MFDENGIQREFAKFTREHLLILRKIYKDHKKTSADKVAHSRFATFFYKRDSNTGIFL